MPLLLRGSASAGLAHPAEESVGDLALVSAALRDPRDFAPLFVRYWSPVLRYCRYRLEGQEDAEDAASQIFVDAYASLHRFQHQGREGAFRSWLFTIAHNEVVTRHRYRARHMTASLDGVADVPDPGPSPEQAGLISGDVARVAVLLHKLPKRPREVVELRLAGLNDREIAAVLGITGAAVRQAQTRAIAALRQRLTHGSDLP